MLMKGVERFDRKLSMDRPFFYYRCVSARGVGPMLMARSETDLDTIALALSIREESTNIFSSRELT